MIKNGGWVKIDLKRLVSKWFRSPETNLGLTFRAHDEDGQALKVVGRETVQFDSELVSFLRKFEWMVSKNIFSIAASLPDRVGASLEARISKEAHDQSDVRGSKQRSAMLPLSTDRRL